MQLLGGFVPLVLHDPAQRDEMLARAEQIASDMAACGGKFYVTAIVGSLDDWFRPDMDEASWTELFANLARVDEITARHGLLQVIHPHVDTLIETAEEFDRFLAESSVKFCLDTGHLTIGGADPVALATEQLDRIGLVHLKDVDADAAARERSGELDLMQATQAGLFPPLGAGMVRLAEVVATLEAAGYDGWYVIEDRRRPHRRRAAARRGSGAGASPRASTTCVRSPPPAPDSEPLGAPSGRRAARRRVDDPLHGQPLRESRSGLTAVGDGGDPSACHHVGRAEHVAVGVVHAVAAHAVPHLVGYGEQLGTAGLADPETAHLLHGVPVARRVDRSLVAVDLEVMGLPERPSPPNTRHSCATRHTRPTYSARSSPRCPRAGRSRTRRGRTSRSTNVVDTADTDCSVSSTSQRARWIQWGPRSPMMPAPATSRSKRHE